MFDIDCSKKRVSAKKFKVNGHLSDNFERIVNFACW
jgi:hypothetical protein